MLQKDRTQLPSLSELQSAYSVEAFQHVRVVFSAGECSQGQVVPGLQGCCRLLPHQVSHGGVEALPGLPTGIDTRVRAPRGAEVFHVPPSHCISFPSPLGSLPDIDPLK